MTTAGGVRRRLEATGLVVRELEPGVLRGYHCTPIPGGTFTIDQLQALFVVRNGTLTYAEFVAPNRSLPLIYWRRGPGGNDTAHRSNLYALVESSTFR